MKQILDITATDTTELVLPVPQSVADALRERGWQEMPEQVTLYVYEATLAERRRFSDSTSLAQAQGNPTGYIADLIASRAAPGTSRELIDVMVEFMTPTAIRKIAHACVNGELPNA